MTLLIGQAYAQTYLPDLDFIVIVAAAVGHTHCYGDWLFDPSIVNFVNLSFAEVFVEVVIWTYMQLMVGIILGSAHGAITSLLGQRYHSSLPTRPTTSRRTHHNDQHTHTYTHTHFGDEQHVARRTCRSTLPRRLRTSYWKRRRPRGAFSHRELGLFPARDG